MTIAYFAKFLPETNYQITFTLWKDCVAYRQAPYFMCS